jgi:hypothetical protein
VRRCAGFLSLAWVVAVVLIVLAAVPRIREWLYCSLP